MRERSPLLNSTDYEWVTCPFCGKDDHTPFVAGPDRLHRLGHDFKLIRCNACDIVYQNPRPTEEAIAQFYPADYPPHQVGSERANAVSRLALRFGAAKRAAAIERFRKSGTILDVGCGSGLFLAEMRRRGWQVLGIDPSERAVATARALYDVEAQVGTLEGLKLPEEAFDVITLWDVIEHLHDPFRNLSHARHRLRPNGLLVVSTPDLGSIDARVFGRYWAGLDLPRHLVLFTPATLSHLLRRAGFEPIALQYFTGNYHTMRLSVEFLIDAWIRAGLLRRLATQAIRFPAVRAAYLLVSTLSNRLRIGPVMTMVALRS